MRLDGLILDRQNAEILDRIFAVEYLLGSERGLKRMKTWKIQLIVTGVFCLLMAIFAIVTHLHIVATWSDPIIVDAKDDSLGFKCGMIFGSGLVFIWALPLLRRFRK